ncbi:MAG: type II toxin-antitoxin system HicB family antitoxin [Candidatus Poribacteria bacterium]|nr:type II toxin-antitoxin system HicB family antitoxin [Candidatus Poribacteria bacterium]MDD9974632.1 type II toxin-antitoxin system HicB family antitoxin [Candidatus Poribacteria bacterium]
MTQTYTAVIQKDEGWWIGWIQEIPGVNCQERTKDALLETLRITLQETIEYNREEAIRRTENEAFEEVTIAL